jgi:hypothetical protein
MDGLLLGHWNSGVCKYGSFLSERRSESQKIYNHKSSVSLFHQISTPRRQARASDPIAWFAAPVLSSLGHLALNMLFI